MHAVTGRAGDVTLVRSVVCVCASSGRVTQLPATTSLRSRLLFTDDGNVLPASLRI